MTSTHFYDSKSSAVLGRGQVVFEEFLASRTMTTLSRPKTSKCVLEDSVSVVIVAVVHMVVVLVVVQCVFILLSPDVVSDANYRTIRALFIAMTTSW